MVAEVMTVDLAHEAVWPFLEVTHPGLTSMRSILSYERVADFSQWIFGMDMDMECPNCHYCGHTKECCTA